MTGTVQDATLLGARGGARDAAFVTLFDRHYAEVYRLALVLLRERSHAQDVAQETFITAWKHWGRIRLVNQSALPWLLVVCRNQARNTLRKRARHATMLDHEIEARAAAQGGEESSSEELRWFLEQLEFLAPIDRRVVELCLIDGLTYQQASESLALTRHAVGKRLERTRTWLREQRESSVES